MKYYEVKAKCGHVGKNNYIIKSFYVYAYNGKDAASRVRSIPRVKHDQKDAIRFVKEITREEYDTGIERNHNDSYFTVDNKKDQSILCVDINEDICRETEKEVYKKQTHKRKHLIENLMYKEWKTERYLAYEY